MQLLGTCGFVLFSFLNHGFELDVGNLKGHLAMKCALKIYRSRVQLWLRVKLVVLYCCIAGIKIIGGKIRTYHGDIPTRLF